MVETTLTQTAQGTQSGVARLWGRIRADWHSTRTLMFGALVVLLGIFVATAYYLNLPAVPFDPDSSDYIRVAHRISLGQWVDSTRVPGYPAFLGVMYAIAGKHNFLAATIVQAALYVLASLGIYVLALATGRRPWAAFLIAALVAANVLLLSYVRPIMTEALALFLVTCLALLVVAYVRWPHARTLWALGGVMLMLSVTRPEWIAFAVILFGFLLVVAWRRDLFRRHAGHIIAVLALFCAACGGYAIANGVLNGTTGFSINENMDLLGKVQQYHMQDEASPQFAAFTRVIDQNAARGDYDPFHLVFYQPLTESHYALAGAYGRDVILHHPVEFAVKTVPVFFQSLQSSDPHQPIDPGAPFASLLFGLQTLATLVQWSTELFPFIGIGWLVVFLLRRRTFDERSAIMTGIALFALYDLAMTTATVFTQYARMNSTYDPLMILVVWTTIGSAIGVALRGRRATLEAA